MLTKKDLTQVRGVMKEEINSVVPELVIAIVKPLKKDIAKLRKEVKFAFNYMDKDLMAEKKRTDKIVKHLDLPKNFGYES